VQLGGIAEGTARTVAKRSSLAEYPAKAVDGRSDCPRQSDGTKAKTQSDAGTTQRLPLIPGLGLLWL
jgi:hypothetical protein